MASIDKFTDEAVCNLLRHNDRSILENSNQEIDETRRELNYSFEMNHGGLTDFEYYKKIRDEKYLYGRGSAREKEAITAASWVVTLPKELLDSPEKQKIFFKGVYDFVSARYGPENIINNAVHYDEGGSPHIHIVFVPTTKLDHDLVHYKTSKTKTVVKTETGRYEYTYRFKLDENGEKILLKNYAKMSDYYDEKISAAEVINKAELQHFHQDLQSYLTANGIEGAVLNGATGGTNISVKSLKEFTKSTGLTLDDVKDLQRDQEHHQDNAEIIKEMSAELRSKDATISSLEQTVKEQNVTIDDLWQQIEEKSKEFLSAVADRSDKSALQNELNNKTKELEELRSSSNQIIENKNQQIRSLSADLTTKDNELLEAHKEAQELQEKVRELEALRLQDQAKIKSLEASADKQKSQGEVVQTEQPAWGSHTWGKSTAWGSTKDGAITKGD